MTIKWYINVLVNLVDPLEDFGFFWKTGLWITRHSTNKLHCLWVGSGLIDFWSQTYGIILGDFGMDFWVIFQKIFFSALVSILKWNFLFKWQMTESKTIFFLFKLVWKILGYENVLIHWKTWIFWKTFRLILVLSHDENSLYLTHGEFY